MTEEHQVKIGDSVVYSDSAGEHEGYIKEFRGTGANRAAVVEFPNSKILNWIVSISKLRRQE